MKRVRIGTIVRPIGLAGHVGVGGSEGALVTLRRVTLRRGSEAGREVAVLEARRQGKLWAVRLEGTADRSAAEELVGSEVLARREDLGDPGEGAHYWGDLEGMAVFTATGERVGTVTDLVETGGVDVLVVTGDQREVLVPLAPYVQVDASAGKVVVDPPEGLLDLGATGVDDGEGPRR